MKTRSNVFFYCFSLILLLSHLFFSCSDVKKNDDGSNISKLIQGSPIHGANGINFNKNDELYVASVVSRAIFHLDKESGEILHRYEVADSVEGPDDLTFGPDQSLYWTDILTGEVGRRTPEGTVSKQFVAPGVNPVTFSDDGRLFVALDFMGDALYELDPELIKPPRLIAENLGWLNAMDWGPDGFLYGPVWSKGQVIKVNVDNGKIDIVSDQLQMPAAVKFDSKGRLHVIDQISGQVSRVDLMTGDLEVVATISQGLDNLAFDSQDRLFVAHAQDGSVVEVLPDGTIREVVAGGIIAAGGLSIIGEGENESIVVSDLFSLREISVNDGIVQKITRHFIGNPGLISPFTTSTDGDHLVLSSWFGNEVQIWDHKEGKNIEEYRDFAVPLNAISFQGNLVVAELGTSPGAAKVTIQKEGNRTTLMDASDGLAVPSGLAATETDLWVADWATGKIFQLIKAGEELESPVVVGTGLSQPEGMAIGPEGALYIAETGIGQVTKLERNGEIFAPEHIKIMSINKGIPAPPNAAPTWVFSGITISSNGTLYSSDDADSKIWVKKL